MGRTLIMSEKIVKDRWDEDTYHCCEWCNNFDRFNNVCHGIKITTEYDMNVESVIEEGRVIEVITESINEEDWNKIFNKIKGFISKTKQKEVDSIFYNVMREYIDNLKDNIANNFEFMLRQLCKEGISKIEIQNPDRFYCKEFR